MVFQEQITKQFTITLTTSYSVPSLTPEEVTALRYVVGYVCRKVKKNIEASKHAHRQVLLLCLMDL